MYCFTLMPSLSGLNFIYFFKSIMTWFLIIIAIQELFDLNSHPAEEKDTWTILNWFLIPFRRVIVDLALNYMYPFTQFIPFLNWILNLIPLGLSYVNVIVL